MVSTPPGPITRESRETDETSCKAQYAKLVRAGPPLAALAGICPNALGGGDLKLLLASWAFDGYRLALRRLTV